MRSSINTARALLITTEQLKQEKMMPWWKIISWTVFALFIAMFLEKMSYLVANGTCML